MDIKTKPLNQINEEAIDILIRELGPSDTARFIRQFTAGDGDYTTRRREQVADTSIEEVMQAVKERRTRSNSG